MDLFDLDLLAKALRDEIDDRELSLRETALEIGCSASTLSRMLQGNEAKNVPDSVNLMRAASWLGKSIGNFERGPKRKQSSMTDVEVHLRALPGLDRADAEALVAAVRATYDTFRKTRKRTSSR